MRLFGEAMGNLFRRPFTRKYPKVKPPLPKGFRGRPVHYPDKCIYCGLCAKYCPSAAIEVDVKEKKWVHHLDRCVFCGQCEEVCREMAKKNAIEMGPEFELATRRRNFRTEHRKTGK